jgi:hypothetical protein
VESVHQNGSQNCGIIIIIKELNNHHIDRSSLTIFAYLKEKRFLPQRFCSCESASKRIVVIRNLDPRQKEFQGVESRLFLSGVTREVGEKLKAIPVSGERSIQTTRGRVVSPFPSTPSLGNCCSLNSSLPDLVQQFV